MVKVLVIIPLSNGLLYISQAHTINWFLVYTRLRFLYFEDSCMKDGMGAKLEFLSISLFYFGYKLNDVHSLIVDMKMCFYIA